MSNTNFYNGKGQLDTKGKFARVSAILDVRHKPEITNWMVGLAAEHGPEEIQRVKDVATTRGTAVHAAIELFINKTEEELLPSDYQPFFDGFMHWWDKVNPTECTTELPLRHSYYRYAGRCDLVCTIDNERWLVDFKTSKRFDPGMGLQLAAYKRAYKSMTGEDVRTGILQLTDKTQKGYRWREYDEPFSVFKAHLDIFRWLEAQKKPVEENTWDGRTLIAMAKGA